MIHIRIFRVRELRPRWDEVVFNKELEDACVRSLEKLFDQDVVFRFCSGEEYFLGFDDEDPLPDVGECYAFNSVYDCWYVQWRRERRIDERLKSV